MNMKKLLLSIGFAVVVANVFGATYTWIGGASGEWSTSTNWNPERTTPASSDVLIFDFADRSNGAGAGTAINVANISNETIAGLQIISSSGGNKRGTTILTLSGTPTTLIISGDLVIGFYASSNNNARLADGGNTIIVGGNFTTVNNQSATSTYHSGSGKLVFTSATATMASGGTGRWNKCCKCNIRHSNSNKWRRQN
jgi:hypothetical protein